MAKKAKQVVEEKVLEEKKVEPVVEGTEEQNSEGPVSAKVDYAGALEKIKAAFPVDTVVDLDVFNSIREAWPGRVGLLAVDQIAKSEVSDESHLIIKYKVDEETYEQKLVEYVTK